MKTLRKESSLPGYETLLAGLLLLEVLIFSKTGVHFATRVNLFEVCRLSTEVGLLALVMTPIILTGGRFSCPPGSWL